MTSEYILRLAENPGLKDLKTMCQTLIPISMNFLSSMSPGESCVSSLPFPKDLPLALPLPLDLDGTMPGATPATPAGAPAGPNNDSKPGIAARLSRPGMELKELRSKFPRFRAPRLIFPRPKLVNAACNAASVAAGAAGAAGAGAGAAGASWPNAAATAAQPARHSASVESCLREKVETEKTLTKKYKKH